MANTIVWNATHEVLTEGIRFKMNAVPPMRRKECVKQLKEW